MRSLLLSIPVLLSLSGVTGCDIPIGAIRRTPPSGIDARIAAVRSPAPDFTLEGTTGRFHLADALAKGPVLLVFYRGHW